MGKKSKTAKVKPDLSCTPFDMTKLVQDLSTCNNVVVLNDTNSIRKFNPFEHTSDLIVVPKTTQNTQAFLSLITHIEKETQHKVPWQSTTVIFKTQQILIIPDTQKHCTNAAITREIEMALSNL